jgi:hypothetical protein
MSLFDKIRQAIGGMFSSEFSGDESEEVIAPADPFARGLEDYTKLSERFNILRAHYVLSLGAIPRYQELRDEGADCWFHPDSPPALILFVSHRWETPYQPDPLGQQIGALKSFLRILKEVAIATECGYAERLQRVPTLNRHGVLQAASLLGVVATGRWRAFLDAVRNSGETETLGDRILGGIGVWYDYACMPQRPPIPGAQRSEKDEAEFIEGLRSLQGLIAESTLLILRHEGDNYGLRGWCAAEVSVGNTHWRHLVLRTDLLGQDIDVKDLRGVHSPEFGDSSLYEEREEIIREIAKWEDPEETNVRGILYMIYYNYLGFQELEEQREPPMFTTPRPPALFPGHTKLLTAMMENQSLASYAETMISDGRLHVDVASWVNEAMDAAELRCSDDLDRLYVGLLILYLRHVGMPQMAAFYADCLQRLLDRKTLRLVHYRELRKYMGSRVWWVFEGEPFESERWDLPQWAR